MKLGNDLGRKKTAENLYLNLLSIFNNNKDKWENTFKEIYNFLYKEIPEILNKREPFKLRFLDSQEFGEFRVRSFFNSINIPRSFYNLDDLLENLNLFKLKQLLKEDDIELIGIDESKVEFPIEGSKFIYIKSTALRIFKNKGGNKKELIGPMIQEIRVNFGYESYQDKKIQLIEYIRNIYIALIAIEIALKEGRRPLLFLHGPLIRVLGGFTDIHFSFEELSNILQIEIKAKKGEKNLENLQKKEKIF